MEIQSNQYGPVAVLAPAGRIDHQTAPTFHDALLGRMGEEEASLSAVIVDLSGVDYISSAGLRAIMAAAKEGKKRGRQLAVAALTPVVREIFEISRFHMVIQVHDQVRDAVGSVSADAASAFPAD